MNASDGVTDMLVTIMPEQLSTLYSDLLDGSYDCVDRIILNAYFSMGQTGEVFAPGGARFTARMPTSTTRT